MTPRRPQIVCMLAAALLGLSCLVLPLAQYIQNRYQWPAAAARRMAQARLDDEGLRFRLKLVAIMQPPSPRDTHSPTVDDALARISAFASVTPAGMTTADAPRFIVTEEGTGAQETITFYHGRLQELHSTMRLAATPFVLSAPIVEFMRLLARWIATVAFVGAVFFFVLIAKHRRTTAGAMLFLGLFTATASIDDPGALLAGPSSSGALLRAVVGAPLVMVAIAAPLVVVLNTPRRHDPRYCRTCRYDLTGNVSGRCPECGTPIPESVGPAA